MEIISEADGFEGVGVGADFSFGCVVKGGQSPE